VDEYKSVLSRAKFGLPPDVLAGWLTLVDRHVAVIDVSGDLPPVRDAKDAMFLACAMAVCADFIVTGDRDLAPEGTPRRIGGTTVVSVADFKGLVCDRWKRE
jgi:putative PIN family toxin of toxin-antitoxin system